MSKPVGRCGYTHDSGWGKDHCCLRETAEGHDYCIWHADVEGKPTEAIRSALHQLDSLDKTQRSIERLDGAILRGVKFDGTISFKDCRLTGADFRESSLQWSDYPGLEMPWEPYSEVGVEGPDFSNADLRGSDFSNADLPQSKFCDTDLRGANFDTAGLANAKFDGANFQSSIFENAYLGWAKMCNTVLAEANFTDARFSNADLTGAFAERTIFHRADFSGATLDGASLYGAVLSDIRLNNGTNFGEYCTYDPLSQHYPPRIPEDALIRGYESANHEKAAWLYRRLKVLHEDNSMSDRASSFHVFEKETTRRAYAKDGEWGKYSISTINRLLTNHGESLGRVVGASLVTILTAAIIYPFVGGVEDGGSLYTVNEIVSAGVVDVFIRSLYFSVITFTTIGYANVAPRGIGSRTMVGIESLMGALLIALIVYVLGRRAAR